jgi:hypothetical protein
MLVRLARMQAVLALAEGQSDLVAQAAQRQAEIARAAGLLEPLADTLLLLASVASSDEENKRLAWEALELAKKSKVLPINLR